MPNIAILLLIIGEKFKQSLYHENDLFIHCDLDGELTNWHSYHIFLFISRTMDIVSIFPKYIYMYVCVYIYMYVYRKDGKFVNFKVKEKKIGP